MTITPYEACKFMRNVLQGDHGCWLWAGHLNPDGSGQFRIWKRRFVAKRFAKFIEVGDIPQGMCVVNKCSTRSCVNPSHLKIVTRKQLRRLPNSQAAVRG